MYVHSVQSEFLKFIIYFLFFVFGLCFEKILLRYHEMM